MKKIIIFSGTTEGRMLSEKLAEKGIPHTVCVATDYGREVMREAPCVQLHVGRMDAGEMIGFLRAQGAGKTDLLIDATHPYAAEVSENIRNAAEETGCGYRRVLRSRTDPDGVRVLRYDDMTTCARAMEETRGAILLTTGSKELPVYCAQVSEETRARTCVRILPASESLEICRTEGIAPDHIIAMQGPCTEEMNLAILRQYHIGHLVTKDSGSTGGLPEKLAAARRAGVTVHLIERPTEAADGIGWEEMLSELLTDAQKSDLPVPSDPATEDPTETPGMCVTLAGMGMGAPAYLVPAVREALEEAEIVFGAGRLLEQIDAKEKHAMYRAADILPVLEERRPGKVVILFSGDSGFYSGAKNMLQALREWRADVRIRVLPGISSVAFLAAKLGESYEDAVILSLHGKNDDEEIRRLIREVRHHSKTCALLSGPDDICRIAEELEAAGIDARIRVGLNLSGPDERLESLTPAQARHFSGTGPATIMILNPSPERRPLLPVLADTDLLRTEVPMTKACIRHESLIRLKLRESDLFYDIGGGTGSVAIEAASLHPSLRVVTIEKDPAAAALIRGNCGRIGTENVTVIEEEASRILGQMDRPDCVFIGGSGGRLMEIVSLLNAKGPGIRFVINTVSLESMEEVRAVIDRYGTGDEEAVQLQVTDVMKRGAHHMLRANNPVTIWSFSGRGV
ncbi:MAG: precorrin-6A reductase [Lachnospiraceae bacterium]|nr:precorrin-6A reductase [Lachnospiraceae bacterium]